jgi:BlaI family penicillinase repressor
MRPPKPELGDLERAVMKVLWSGGASSAEVIRERLSRGLKEATVRTVLRRLEGKGYVTHKVETRTFIYEATEPRNRVAARAIKRIVDWFCDGSVDEVLVGMVDAKMVDRKQLDHLLTVVEGAEARKKAKVRRTRKDPES